MNNRVYKYGMPRPFKPDGPFGPGSPVIKYAPPESMGPELEEREFPEVNSLKEVALMSQIEKSLEEVEKLLEQLRQGAKSTKKIVDKLGNCIAELSFLYVKLKDFLKDSGKKKRKKPPKMSGSETIILYIVMAPK